MKIRLRLAIISILLIAVSMTLCGTLLLKTAARNSIQSAEDGARTELSMLRTSYASVLQDMGDPSMSETAQRSLALYLFRQYISSSSQFILIRNGETLYNNSDYAVDKLLGGQTQKTVTMNGKTLFLAAGEEGSFQSSRYQIYLVRDVTDVYAGVQRLTWQFVAICAGSFLVSACIIMLCTFRALRPLHTLQENAAAMAGGVYDQRIEIHGRDEIAELANSFNKMADAVQTHIETVTATAEERKLLLGALTHELKTPMTSIIGYSESLQKTKLTRLQREDAVSYINRECSRLERLTQKMMRLITLTGGEEIALADTPAATLLATVEPTLQDAANRQGVSVELQDHGTSYKMDVDLMASVLINLFDNACAASAKHIRIEAFADRLAVTDDGSGIPQEMIERITQPFFRVDKSRSRQNGNAGLGLALVSRIAELHHAELVIESELGKGTKMTLVFEGQSSV